MRFPLPTLDDQLGRRQYIDGALWRRAYDPVTRELTLRRDDAPISLARALVLIEAGELIWMPPADFSLPGSGQPAEDVQRELALLEAYRRSPAYGDIQDAATLRAVDARIREMRGWLARRALPSGGDHGQPDDAEGRE